MTKRRRFQHGDLVMFRLRMEGLRWSGRMWCGKVNGTTDDGKFVYIRYEFTRNGKDHVDYCWIRRWHVRLIEPAPIPMDSHVIQELSALRECFDSDAELLDLLKSIREGLGKKAVL